MKNSVSIILSLVIIVLLSSCKKDKENPVILVNSPEEHTYFFPGDTIQIGATFQDDQELASYYAYMSDKTGNRSTIFPWEESGILTGSKYDYYTSLIIPMGLDSTFYFHFEVVDAKGKASQKYVEFHVEP